MFMPFNCRLATLSRPWRGGRLNWKPSAVTALFCAASAARFVGGHRPAENIALDVRAAELADQGQLVMGLGALGGGVHAEALGEGDDGADDRGVAAARLGGAADEALVDLDLVERRLLQIAERGIAGAEIVEREADADRLQLGEHVVGRFAFDQEHAFGDLELELARLAVCELASALTMVAGRLGSANWIGERLTATRMFSGHFAASMQAVRSTHSPICEDQAAFLGERDEQARRDRRRGSDGASGPAPRSRTDPRSGR